MDLRQARQIDLRENAKHGRELSSYEYLLVLLQMGASIEHALMVQYLYAAYSLRDDVKEARGWRETLLLIAREEMGHLLTVQNILALLGGPINIDREDYPWDTPFQAFPFQLERLTRGSLACYCYAEMPAGLEKVDSTLAQIWEDAKKHVNVKQEQPIEVNHVGKLYHHIIEILGNPKEIPDHCFVDAAFGQMSWDDWGRSYRGDPPSETTSSLASAQSGMERANMFIRKVTTREQAILALAELSEQGEGLVAVDKLLGGSEILQAVRASAPKLETKDTHYGRFCQMYDDLCKYESRLDHSPFSWEVPRNPSSDYSEERRSAQDKTADETTKIENRTLAPVGGTIQCPIPHAADVAAPRVHVEQKAPAPGHGSSARADHPPRFWRDVQHESDRRNSGQVAIERRSRSDRGPARRAAVPDAFPPDASAQ